MTHRVTVISGGSRGIRAAIAKRLAADHYGLMINYQNNEASAQRVRDKILAMPGYQGRVADNSAFA